MTFLSRWSSSVCDFCVFFYFARDRFALPALISIARASKWKERFKQNWISLFSMWGPEFPRQTYFASLLLPEAALWCVPCWRTRCQLPEGGVDIISTSLRASDNSAKCHANKNKLLIVTNGEEYRLTSAIIVAMMWTTTFHRYCLATMSFDAAAFAVTVTLHSHREKVISIAFEELFKHFFIALPRRFSHSFTIFRRQFSFPICTYLNILLIVSRRNHSRRWKLKSET